MDRRIERTRKILREALLTLMREKPMEKIEIQEITDCANTARVTFYRHYGTKEELLIDTIEEIYQQLKDGMSAISVEQIMDFQQTPPVCILFQFLEHDRLLYKKLFMGSASALIQQRIRHYIVKQVIEAFSQAQQYAELPIILIANHMASTTIGNVMWWLADDLPYSADYMAKLTHWAAVAGIMTLIGRREDIAIPPDNLWHVAHPTK